MHPPLAIVGARLITGADAPALPTSTILVGSDGLIAAAGPPQVTPIPAEARRVTADGLTALPGLIDGHVHLTWDKSLYTAYASKDYSARLLLRDEARQLVRAGHFAQLALAAGVTTLRDCGADDYSVLALREAVTRGEFVGPRILACGRPITTTGGHIYSDWGVDGREEIRKAVRQLAARNVDFIKLVLSGGTTTPGTNIAGCQYGLDELRVAVDEAHRQGRPIAVHAISTESIGLAAAAGVDTIEHCSWIGRDPQTTVTDSRAVDAMLANGVRVDHAIIPRPYLFPDEAAAEATPEERWWLRMLQVRWPFLHVMRQQGVPVFLGTDAAFGPWPGSACWPGFEEMARAMEVLVRWATFDPMDVIRMATGEAARALGLADVGRLAPGHRADLILVAGDPLADIRALRRVEFVFRDGRLVAHRGRLALPGAEGHAA